MILPFWTEEMTMDRYKYINKKRKTGTVIGLVFLCILLAACGAKKTPDENAKKGADPLKAAQSKFAGKEANASDPGKDDAKGDPDDENGDDIASGSNEAGGDNESGKADGKMTDDDGTEGAEGGAFPADNEELGLIVFDDMFNGAGYNGFLLCDYDNPYEIDWHEVMYNGAGIGTWELTDEQLKAYLKKIGESELMTDVTAFTKADFEDFVRLHTGTDPADMKKPLHWTYLPEFDLYAYQHGDTNQLPVEYVSETVDGNTHIIRYSYSTGNEGSGTGTPNEVKFKVENGNCVFISNKINEDPYGGYTNNTEYVFPFSSERRLYEDDLWDLSEWELRIARNEIYARHGRKFSDKELQEYFDSCSWYYGTIEPKKWKEDALNKIEKDNIKLISDYEKKYYSGD